MAGLAESMRVPKNRIAVIIGPKGGIKKEIERKTKTRIKVDSEEGEIEVTGKAENTAGFYSALNIIKAIGRGFSPEHAFLLLQETTALEIMDLSDWFKSEKEIQTKKGRIIGTAGKTRSEIEQKTNCYISVQGKTVGIIGEMEEVPRARRAIEMLLQGSRHSKVYDYLNRSSRKNESW